MRGSVDAEHDDIPRLTYRNIVVHVDEGARCATRIDVALALALRHGSRMVGVAPTGLPDVELSIALPVPESFDLEARSAAELRARAEHCAASFAVRCRTRNVAGCEPQVIVDEAVDAVVRYARCSDLLVVSQTDTSAPVPGVAFDFPQQVVLHGGAPTLVVPCAGSFESIGRRVLIGWKDTREAARAVRDALPLLRGADHVHVYHAAEGPTCAADEVAPLVSWFAAHGVVVEMHREVAATEDVGNQLLARAAELDVDLIVCGAYGHSRLREWLLGGVTRSLLRRMTLPTLFSH